MTYSEKAEKFRELVYRANGLDYPPKDDKIKSLSPTRQKWKSVKELNLYLEHWGGGLKGHPKKRRGYLVVPLQDETIQHKSPVFAEVPMDFAMKVIAMGGFP